MAYLKRPELHQLADLAQIVAAVGVIVSLAYVATEVHQNTSAVRAGTVQSMTAMTVQLRSTLVTDPTLAAIAVKVTAAPDSLNTVDVVRFNSWAAAVLRQFENLHYQYRSGTLDPGLWKGYDRMIRHSLDHTGLRRWYDAHQDEYSDDFRSYVRSIPRS